jgi:DNA-binding NtrC family response regulator
VGSYVVSIEPCGIHASKKQKVEKRMEERCLRVLLIEDDEDDYIITRELLSETEDVRFHLEWASTYETGLSMLLGHSCDVCLLDFRLGERSGLELLQEAKDAGCDIPIILLTGQGGFRIDLEAMKAGASDYLDKE